MSPGCEAHFNFQRDFQRDDAPASGWIGWPQGRVARGSGPVSTSEWRVRPNCHFEGLATIGKVDPPGPSTSSVPTGRLKNKT